MFFILVHSDFLRILLPDHVSYTNSKVNKKFHEKHNDTLLQHYLSEKQRSATVQRKNENGELQEQELVLLL
jgi:hypothetical protein